MILEQGSKPQLNTDGGDATRQHRGESARSDLDAARDSLVQIPLGEQLSVIRGLGRALGCASLIVQFIVMKQRACSEEDAYALLRRTAMNQNRKIAELARSLIAAAALLRSGDAND